MSASTKKKHVISEIMDDNYYTVENQTLVKVLGPRGNHLYEVIAADGTTFLASMPSKFRNTVWIKNGSFVVIEPIEEGNKVKGEIVKILLKHHIKQMKKDGKWIQEFNGDADPNFRRKEEFNFCTSDGEKN